MITNNFLDALQGRLPSLDSVMIEASPASGETLDLGMCARLNTSGELVAGVAANATMPLWVYRNHDVQSEGDTSASVDAYKTIGVSDKLGCVVGTGEYELVSTQFVSGTYNPGVLIYSIDAGGADDGKITATGTLGTTTVVGIVSRGEVSHKGKTAVAFWPILNLPNT